MTAPAVPLDPLALAALAAQAARYARQMAYAQLDPQLTVVQASANFGPLLGLPEASIEGQPLADLVWEFVGAEAALEEILTGARADLELEGINRQRPEGGLAYFDFRVAPLALAGAPGGLLFTVEDTTAKSQLEQQLTQDRNELRLVEAQLARSNAELERLSRYKSFLLSMVAHDLRTPLGAIGGYAALLLDELAAALSEDQRDSLAAIAALAERLNGLIENVLDLDQIEQGRLVLHKRACDLNQLVREIVQTLAPPLALRRLALELVLTEPAVTLEADPARLLQILHNLLSNAIKYSNDGGQIQVSTGREAAEAVVTVADTGLGMTEAQLANLFRLYYRTDNARLSKVAGTGLGLYIVRTLVELHGGRVAVASQPGQGTRVSVYLPAPGPDR